MAFTGFPAETFTFLKGLTANNNKTWFDDHRSGYDKYWLEPAKDFVAEIGPQIQKFAPDVNFEPKISGSILRINRDVRFSTDKRPYKTTLDLWFWKGDKRSWENPGLFLRLLPDSFIAGGGMHGFTPAQRASFRAAILDNTSGSALEAIEKSLGTLTLSRPTRKSVPRDLDPDHPRARYLLHENLHATCEAPLPESVHAAGFVGQCLAIFRQAMPVAAWLKENI